LVNTNWVFPELASEILSQHKDFFSKINPAGIPLTRKELNKYGSDSFLAGWTFQLKTESSQVALLLDKYTPFSIPRIALTTNDFFLKWPHVEESGLLCLRDDNDTINHFSGISLTEYYIKRAEELIGQNLKNEIIDDFRTEFVNYWGYWCVRKRRQPQKVVLLSNPQPPSRKIYVYILNKDIIVSDSIDEGILWAEARLPDQTIEEKNFNSGAFIWLPEAILPDQYPKSNLSAAAIVKSCAAKDWSILADVTPDEVGSIIMVFGFESGNGPAFGGIRFNEPMRSVQPGKKIYSREKGFRKKKKFSNAVKQKYFTADGKIDALPVQRVDREWIFERGSTGLKKYLDMAKVGIIGCGSLGSQVTRLLVESGVKKFLLIDPDDLSWDNIARHLLGARHTNQKKVKTIKEYLDSQFPSHLEIEVEPDSWQTVFSEKKETLLSCDLIISTVGDWDSEAALNYTYNTIADFPKIIYGWTEPYGFAGHALAILGIGGCLSCGMDDRGSFQFRATQWNLERIRKLPPACGQTYQPYGALDIAGTQAMIAKLAIDVLSKTVSRSQHRVWVGDLSKLQESGGKLSESFKDQHPESVNGNQMIIDNWSINNKCSFRHKG